MGELSKIRGISITDAGKETDIVNILKGQSVDKSNAIKYRGFIAGTALK